MTQDYIPFQAIVTEIKRLCDLRLTGTMFVATKANRSAQIVLEKGEIVFIYFFNKKGQEAMELMLEIVAGRFRFQEGTAPARRSPLPPTEEIIRFFQSRAGNETAAVGTAPASASAPDAEVLGSDQKAVLEAALAEFIGPMAGIICEDYLSSAKDLSMAIDSLAAEIPSADQAQKFRMQVKAKLG